MRTAARISLNVLLALAAALSAVWVSASDLPRPSTRWIEVRTEHFLFFSNAGKVKTKRLAVDLEELRAALGKLTDYDLQAPVPTFIFVFKSDWSFIPYKNLYEGKPAAVSGYFIEREHGNYIAVHAEARDGPAVVFHEYVHYVAATNSWQFPLWFEEGLAEFYQSFEVVNETIYIGLPITEHLLWLRGSTPIPLAQLLTVDRDSPLYNERDRKGAFYAQSWALVHYLLLGNEERRLELQQYLALLRDGTPESQAFSTAFGTDYKTLESELRSHLLRSRLPYGQTSVKIRPDSNLEVRPMSYADVLYRLGDLLQSQDSDRPEIVEHFVAALRADSGHGLSLAALGLTAELEGDREKARAYYERALRAAPDDPLILFRWGEFLQRSGGDLESALTALLRSVEIDPTFAPTWVALAEVYADTGSTSAEALRAGETAHRLVPYDLATTGNLLALYLRMDRRDEAAALIEKVFKSDPSSRAHAWMVLLQSDLLLARGLVHQDLPEAALRRLEIAKADADRASNPEIIEDWIAEIQRTAAEHEGAKGYRSALELYEGGDIAAARRLLEKLLTEVDEGTVARSCRQLLSMIDNPPPTTLGPDPAAVLSLTPAEIDQLNGLISQNKLESALRLLQELRSHSSGANSAWLDAKTRAVRRALEYNHFVDGYNLAVDHFNREAYPEAIAVLEELIACLPDGPEADAARLLLEDSRRAQDD